MFTVTAMDHIVLNVQDMPKVLDFYINVLGLQGERIDEFHQGKVPFPSVRINADTLIDLFPISAAAETASGISPAHLNHFCLVIDKTDMQHVIAHLEKHGVAVQQGPCNAGEPMGMARRSISVTQNSDRSKFAFMIPH